MGSCKTFPQTIDPIKFAKSRRLLSGTVSLVEFSRLAEFLHSQEGSVGVRLGFDLDEEKRPCVEIQITGLLPLTCQRCLGVLSQAVSIATKLSMVESELYDLPPHYEPLLVEEGVFEVFKLIEDELLLALPLVPKHSDDCIHPSA